MFAILPLSRGLKGLGDLESLRLPRRGDSDSDENCWSGEAYSEMRLEGTHLVLRPHKLTFEVVNSLVTDENASTKIVECGVLRTFQQCRRQPEDIFRYLQTLAMCSNWSM